VTLSETGLRAAYYSPLCAYVSAAAAAADNEMRKGTVEAAYFYMI
jgi:hypothetical protein